MISIEAWRCSIGCHNSSSGRHTFNEGEPINDGISTGAHFIRSSMGSAIRPATLIVMLLLIGCVESNPGPTHGQAEGTKRYIFVE